MEIEIMDTTLRDGEQTSGVSSAGKANYCAILLEELNVDRIEIASARVSEVQSKRDNGLSTKGYETASKF
jgi:D-citramalate synthase